MGDRIWLNMEDLDEVNEGLIAAIGEFEDASENNSDALDAVGRPAGRGELRGKLDDFESGWDHNREQLTESLVEVQEHLQAIIDGFRELDAGLESSMSEAEFQTLQNSGADNVPV